MSDAKELKKIKKIYGENFMHLCRELFPTILEQEGTLLKILEQKFAPNCNSLYESITQNGLKVDFKDRIYNEFYKAREEKEEEKKEKETRTPYEILKEAGYTLCECKTEEDIQKFRKYYDPKEVLCTIYNGRKIRDS